MPAASIEFNHVVTPRIAHRPEGLGWLARLVHRIEDARMRQAERSIAHYIERNGGRLTDDLERRISGLL